MKMAHQGRCFCGAVKIEVSGEPAAMGYCHCGDCRLWSAGPVNAFSLWPPASVKVVAGADQLATYNKTDRSYRKFCKSCGGHVMADHPVMGLVDVYAAVLPDLAFKPQVHVFYAEKVLSIKDGLPKMKDVPAEMGGSGQTLPE
jgi:hypothetical protein